MFKIRSIWQHPWVVVDDLWGLSIPQSWGSIDLLANFTMEELYNSDDLQLLIDNWDIKVFNHLNWVNVEIKWSLKEHIDSYLTHAKPYISTSWHFPIYQNTSGTIVFEWWNFDDNMYVEGCTQFEVTALRATPTRLEVDYTVPLVTQPAMPFKIMRWRVEHYWESPTVEITDVVMGGWPAGTFTTDFNTDTNSAARWPDWDLSIYWNINSLDWYFNTTGYNNDTTSGGTWPWTWNDPFGNGAGQYMYTECSWVNNWAGQYGIARTSNFRDLTNIAFSYHMFWTAFGDFSLRSQNIDNTWTQRRLVNWQQQTNQSDPAIDISLNTTSRDCKAIEFRFASPTSNTWYSADICIDDIIITSV